jgi:hypothetical protein
MSKENDKKEYDDVFASECETSIKNIKRLLTVEDGTEVGNYYILCGAAGSDSLLIINTKKKDPEGQLIKGIGRKRKGVKLLKQAKYSTGSIVIKNKRLIFLESIGTASTALQKQALLKIAKVNSKLNILKKVKFSIEEAVDDAASSQEVSEISAADLAGLGMEPEVVGIVMDALNQDGTLKRLLTPEKQAEISRQTQSFGKNLAAADKATIFDSSGIPCTLDPEVGSTVPEALQEVLVPPNENTSSMIDDRHQVSAQVIIKIHKEAEALPSNERANYVSEQIDLARSHHDAASKYIDAYNDSI